ncbi:hypothetical protein VP01_1800g1 [Puccinia sorghi]|uniref:Uncharacterized protein n=1 Tax=Puccinia sorghi TaxID=27349 RepID=A0A0L6VEV1_9BASI|nr:hypothetical protein VP01_1800g1 [Puccinia sorghi]
MNKLCTELNTSHNVRALLPHLALPRQPAVGLRKMGAGPYQWPQIQCYYHKEAVHTVMFFPHLTDFLDKKLLFKQGPKYYYPNIEPIPTDSGESIQDLMWSPPEMNYGEENEDKHIGFGLHQFQKSSGNSPTATPPNQEANKQPRQRRECLAIPGQLVKDLEGQVVDKGKFGGGLRKKILKQSFTLTLEELLLIAPKFVMKHSHNSGRCNLSNCEEVSFIERGALVNNGAELRIMPEEGAGRNTNF